MFVAARTMKKLRSMLKKLVRISLLIEKIVAVVKKVVICMEESCEGL